MTEQELVELGMRFSTARAIEQGDVSVAAAKKHVERFGKKFTLERIGKLESLLGTVRSLWDEQSERKIAAATGNEQVDDLVGEGKEWLRGVNTAAENAFQTEPEVRNEFYKAPKVGTSVPKLLAALTGHVALVQAYRAALEAEGIDGEELARGQRILADLSAANTAQEQTLQNLPPKTRELNTAKARLYLMLKQLARVARLVFRNDPASAAIFGLTIIHRRGGSRAASAPVPGSAALAVQPPAAPPA